MTSDGVNVLVVFYSRYGTTEQLALSAGVGALQARGNIRLRRLAGHGDERATATSAGWAEHLTRMQRDYVTPRSADSAWADLILLAAPADAAQEIASYRTRLLIEGMAAKIGPPMPATPAEALEYGRTATESARKRRQAAEGPL
jgi:hypothetical protein